MELRLKVCPSTIEENTAGRLPFVKLHSTLSFLMTQYYQHRSPKLAQYIVHHIRLIIEHPDVDSQDECRTLYLQLLAQWQQITLSLFESDSHSSTDIKLKH